MLDEAKLGPTLRSALHNKSNVGRNCCPIDPFSVSACIATSSLVHNGVYIHNSATTFQFN